MNLWITNLTTSVQCNDDELAWLTTFLTFADSSESYYTTRGEAKFAGSTQRKLYNIKARTFPAGLTALVRREAMEMDFTVHVIDKRTRPADIDLSIDLDWLKERKLLNGAPFQYDGVMRVLTRTRGLLHCPTGSGKTEVAVGLMKAVPEVRWLFIAPEADLMENGAKRWELRVPEEPCGRAGSGHWPKDNPRVVFATVQTIAARLRDPDRIVETIAWLEQFTGFVYDECHTLPSAEAYRIAMLLKNAYYRVGMSGTTLARGDSRNMYILAALGEVIYRIRAQSLIDAGWISRPTIRFVKVTQDKPKNTTYLGAYKERVVRSKVRNKVLVTLAEKAPKPALLFIKFKDHGRALRKELADRGVVKSRFLHGEMGLKERDSLIKDLQWGDVDVIVCTKVLQVGTDIPELASLIIGSGGASAIEAIQRIGRGMRIVRDAAGVTTKSTVDVWDVMDTDAKEVNPSSGRKRATKMKWFEKHSKARFASYQGEGYPTMVLSQTEGAKYGSPG